jgi:hypothetical protein
MLPWNNARTRDGKNARSTALALLALGFAGVWAMPARAAVPSVGIYDENTVQPNAVDVEAAGNTLTLARMKSDVLAGFPINAAGVLNGNSTGAFSFGAGQSKSLIIESTITHQTLGVGNLASATFATPISGTGAFGLTAPNHYSIGPVVGGVAGEHISEFGLTVLSMTSGLGMVTVSVDQSDGTTQSVLRNITASNGGQDTFFGFTAPAGVGITGFSIAAPQVGVNTVWYDDIGFVTSALPEPASFGLLIPWAMMILRRRPIAR